MDYAYLDNLLIILILDGIFGDCKIFFYYIRHPIIWIGSIILYFDKFLNKNTLSPREKLYKGIFTTFFIIILVTISSAILSIISYYTLYSLIEILVVAILVSQKSLYQHVKLVFIALKYYNLEKSRKAVSQIVGRNTKNLNKSDISKAAIESCAENFSDGIVAPMFWFIIGGIKGIFIYKAINTLDSMIGYRNERYFYFGKFSAKLDDIINFIPARISGIMIYFSTFFIIYSKSKNCWTTILYDSRKHDSPNAGWAQAAFAGALNISVAGSHRYGNTIGYGRSRLDEQDIERSLRLLIISYFMNVCWLCGIKIIFHSLSIFYLIY